MDSIKNKGLDRRDGGYDRVLERWRNAPGTTSNPWAKRWRDEFVSRLEKREWSDLIRKHAGACKDDVQALLESVNGDPLRFLARLGVATRGILRELTMLRHAIDQRSRVARELTLRSMETLTSDFKLFKTAGERLAPYAELLGGSNNDKTTWPTSLEGRLPFTVNVLKHVARFLKKELLQSDLGAPIHARRGAPSKEPFYWAIGTLLALSEPELTKRFGKNAQKICFSAIAALLKCAFPANFKGENPVRVVKDGYRELRKRHAGKPIVLPIRKLAGNTWEIIRTTVPGVDKQPQKARQRHRASRPRGDA